MPENPGQLSGPSLSIDAAPSTATTKRTTAPAAAAAAAGAKPRAKRPASKPYIPRLRSGGWAILRAMETFPRDAIITKAEIIREARKFCDSSFDVPLDNAHYTAWNSMKKLEEVGYV